MTKRIIQTAPRIGVLALQGAFREHIEMLYSLRVDAREIRTPEELDQVEGLIMPGGESTTIGKLAASYGLLDSIRSFIAAGKPVWGTCAGMIFLASEVGCDQPILKVMDITVTRNAFGRQRDSFEQDIAITEINRVLGEELNALFPAIFIRAPIIEAVGTEVQILSTLPDGKIVAAKQGNLLATSFHPELTEDSRIHRYFLTMIDPD
ncbi:glutamine amidotransferase subunit PdxT [Candidatus Wirthbacteria bacterium CG2_30_54_11]|uniref:Pyridoxal 5'-phosphate synthase subunit PdxT n=1 Tax=Candidatus Wirthbacteria bacterium CG2_30_54_11 TaxID=1817892 RepID=A0A1J5IZ57_9BACT|nr:MAG: glutamine amidotransferase subunit PdxT [Candidatus Wirthbacteria bacterium CG2_30_54_11]